MALLSLFLRQISDTHSTLTASSLAPELINAFFGVRDVIDELGLFGSAILPRRDDISVPTDGNVSHVSSSGLIS